MLSKTGKGVKGEPKGDFFLHFPRDHMCHGWWFLLDEKDGVSKYIVEKLKDCNSCPTLTRKTQPGDANLNSWEIKYNNPENPREEISYKFTSSRSDPAKIGREVVEQLVDGVSYDKRVVMCFSKTSVNPFSKDSYKDGERNADEKKFCDRVVKRPAPAPTAGDGAGAPPGGDGAGAPAGGDGAGAPAGGDGAGAPAEAPVSAAQAQGEQPRGKRRKRCDYNENNAEGRRIGGSRAPRAVCTYKPPRSKPDAAVVVAQLVGVEAPASAEVAQAPASAQVVQAPSPAVAAGAAEVQAPAAAAAASGAEVQAPAPAPAVGGAEKAEDRVEASRKRYLDAVDLHDQACKKLRDLRRQTREASTAANKAAVNLEDAHRKYLAAQGADHDGDDVVIVGESLACAGARPRSVSPDGGGGGEFAAIAATYRCAGYPVIGTRGGGGGGGCGGCGGGGN